MYKLILLSIFKVLSLVLTTTERYWTDYQWRLVIQKVDATQDVCEQGEGGYVLLGLLMCVFDFTHTQSKINNNSTTDNNHKSLNINIVNVLQN